MCRVLFATQVGTAFDELYGAVMGQSSPIGHNIFWGNKVGERQLEATAQMVPFFNKKGIITRAYVLLPSWLDDNEQHVVSMSILLEFFFFKKMF